MPVMSGNPDFDTYRLSEDHEAIRDAIRDIATGLNVLVTPIGHAGVGAGIVLTHRAQRLTLPERLGFTH